MRRSVLLPWVLAGVAMAVTGCASSPGIPDTTYFRLPPRQVAPIAETPPLTAPIEVATFVAEGVHSDQALLYSLDPEGQRLRAYHYQLWVDPPTRMLQQRLIGSLRDANIAPVVAARLPARDDRWQIRGHIDALERIRRDDGWYVQVALQLRADHGDEALPRLIRDYRELRPAGGESVNDAVRTLGDAIDAIYRQFTEALLQAARQPPAAGQRD